MSSREKVAALVKAILQASSVASTPPVGTALGPCGVNIMEFVKVYNAATESQRGSVIPVRVTIYEDHTFIFIMKTPPAAELIKKTAGVQSGSDNPLKNRAGKLTKNQVRETAMVKLPGLNTNDIDIACKIVGGTTRSMGVTVE